VHRVTSNKMKQSRTKLPTMQWILFPKSVSRVVLNISKVLHTCTFFPVLKLRKLRPESHPVGHIHMLMHVTTSTYFGIPSVRANCNMYRNQLVHVLPSSTYMLQSASCYCIVIHTISSSIDVDEAFLGRRHFLWYHSVLIPYGENGYFLTSLSVLFLVLHSM
jgi:hypothetical protein